MAGFFVRPRGGRFVLILCVFSLLIALGGHTPFLELLYKAGIATSIRYPEKFVLIAIFAVIVFGSQMLDRMLRGDEAVRDAVMGFVLATTVVAAVIAIAGFTPYYGQAFTKIWGISGAAGTTMIKMSHQGWMIAVARGAILFGLLWIMRKMKPHWWVAALAIYSAVDILPVVHQLNPRMPAKFFTTRPAAAKAFPENREPFRIFHESDWYGQEEMARKYFSTGDAVYWIVRNGLFPMTPVSNGLRMVIERDYDKTALLPSIDFIDSVWDVKRAGRTDWWEPFVAMSNAWYRGVYRPFEDEKKRVKGKMKGAQAIEFVELEHHPRYYFADQMVSIRDRKDFVKKLVDGSYSKRVAFVREPAFVPAKGTVFGYRETANTAAIDVESFGKSFLVMSVTPHKYWRIVIDGKTVKPVVTNIGYQGVVVPPGRHRVEMRYRNYIAAGGAKVSIAAVVLLLAGVLLPRRRRAAR
jgi:hypothetical protein